MFPSIDGLKSSELTRLPRPKNKAEVAELAYAQVSEACAARLEGSNPSFRTIFSDSRPLEGFEGSFVASDKSDHPVDDRHSIDEADGRPELSRLRAERRSRVAESLTKRRRQLHLLSILAERTHVAAQRPMKPSVFSPAFTTLLPYHESPKSFHKTSFETR